jgi:hypothetical protein
MTRIQFMSRTSQVDNKGLMRITERHISNQRRAITHCPQGHGYTQENTRLFHGERSCKACSHERYLANKEVVKERAAKWAKANPERRKEIQRAHGRVHDRRHQLHAKYDMSLEDYQQEFEKQGGVCKICRKPEPKHRPLHIDHDHKTGEFRGLLCGNCNRALGLFHDEVEVLANAVIYLGGSRGEA